MVLREVAAEEVVEITVSVAEAGEILVEEIIVPVIISVDAVAWIEEEEDLEDQVEVDQAVEAVFLIAVDEE